MIHNSIYLFEPRKYHPLHLITQNTCLLPDNQAESYIFKDYTSEPLAVTNFYDAAPTMLMASMIYHLSVQVGVDTYIPLGEKSRTVLAQSAVFSIPIYLMFQVYPLTQKLIWVGFK